MPRIYCPGGPVLGNADLGPSELAPDSVTLMTDCQGTRKTGRAVMLTGFCDPVKRRAAPGTQTQTGPACFDLMLSREQTLKLYADLTKVIDWFELDGWPTEQDPPAGPSADWDALVEATCSKP